MLSVYFRTLIPIYIEFDSYFTDREVKQVGSFYRVALLYNKNVQKALNLPFQLPITDAF